MLRRATIGTSISSPIISPGPYAFRLGGDTKSAAHFELEPGFPDLDRAGAVLDARAASFDA
jgi:hypothetical protein